MNKENNVIIDENFVYEKLEKINPFKENGDFNDIHIARLFSQVFAEILIYNKTIKKYMYYDGVYWQTDDGTRAEYYAQIFALGLIKYTLNLTNTDIKKRIYRLTDRTPRITLIKDAKANNTCDTSEFDKDPYLINVRNGIINLRDGSFFEHDIKYKFSKIADTIYDPNFDKNNRWTQFIDEITSGNEFKARYLQTVLGYSLLGIKKEEKIWILHGPSTRNGKSTLIESVCNVLGDYAVAAQPETFEQKVFGTGGSGATEDVARLAGSRLVRVSEPPKGMKLDCKKVMEMTGQDRITARDLFSRSFEFRAGFTMIFLCNNLPIINDDAMFSSNRIKIIPFNESFPDGSSKQDKNLKELFATDTYKSIILNWLLDGLYMYNTRGLIEPSEVIDATNDYRAASDAVQGFINKCLVKSDGYVKANLVYDAYVQYCNISNIAAEGKMTFYNALRVKNMFVTERRINGEKVKNFIPGMALIQIEKED